MKVTFQDYYGQHVLIHNETGSGNIRLNVKTCKNLNNVKLIEEKDFDLETDLSLDQNHLRILIGALQSMEE